MKQFLTIIIFLSSFISFAEDFGEVETNSLIVAYQLLDDSWIQDVGALTSDWSRVYYSSLSSSQPPTYGVMVPDANNRNLTYREMSQKDLWDYMYNTPASNGYHNFRYLIENDNDGLGDYILVTHLLLSIGWGSGVYDNNRNLVYTLNDMSLISVSHRLATLNTQQTVQELRTMSNSVCNCDFTIVSNIYVTVQGIKSGLYSTYNGQNWSAADWTKFIWTYLTTNNSGKPIKELLNDISSYSSTTSDATANIYDWLLTNGGSLTNSLDLSAIELYTRNVGGGVFSNNWASAFSSFRSKLSGYTPSSLDDYLSYYLAYDGLNDTVSSLYRDIEIGSARYADNFLTYIGQWTSFNGLIDYLNYINTTLLYSNTYPISNIYSNTIPIKTSWDSLTNKTTSVPYVLVEPSQGRDIYGSLTNAYITSGSLNSSSWTWFDRVEMLLAALVFPETSSSNSVADADTAQDSAESQSDQFKDVLTSIESIAFSTAKQQTQSTADTFTGFFTSLNSALTLNPPEALIIPVPNTPPDVEDAVGDYAWTIDFSSGNAKVTIEFCRALSSFIVIVGFLFVVWKIGLLTFHVTITISSLCFKTVQRLLGK